MISMEQYLITVFIVSYVSFFFGQWLEWYRNRPPKPPKKLDIDCEGE